jgi:hypothetical protein
MVAEATFEETASGLVPSNASSPEETQDGSIAYARFQPGRETGYPAGLLPGD